MVVERTFVMIKPDGVQRGLVGEIVKRFEVRGLKIVGLKFRVLPKNVAEEQYEMHVGKPFYESLIEYVTSGPVVEMVLEGENAVEIVRRMTGATNPSDAAPGTIRGDYAVDIGRNIVHAADTPENADREIKLHFTSGELFSYRRIDEEWLLEKKGS